MLRSMAELEDYAIRATDGIVGHVKNFYFDDTSWVIRYLVVDTGTWLTGRKVLISPISIGQPDWNEKVLPVSLTKQQLENSPDIDTHKPVSRQHEIDYFGYFGYPFYWGGAGLWGEGILPNTLMPSPVGLNEPLTSDQPDAEHAADTAHHDEDAHLQSCKAVMDYHLQAIDGDIGHVQGCLVDEDTWAIRYFIVDTSNWWLGHQVLIAPQWIQNVSWSDATVSVNLTQQSVKNAPPYDPTVELDREQEMNIHKHYDRPGYWDK